MPLSPYHRSRLLLLIGVAACIALFLFTARTFHVPAYRGVGGSILQEPRWLVNLVVVAGALIAAVLAGTLLAGTVRFDAGLFCACAGLAVLSMRAGTTGDVLRAAAPTGSPSVFMHLALELAVLYALVALSWSALWGLHARGWLKADEFRDGVEDTVEPVYVRAGALAMQVGIMALCLLLLAQTDAKVQVLLGVFLSAWAGACVAYYLYPISPSPWLWAGPLLVGVAGYGLAYFGVAPDGAWRNGHPQSALAALARPLPLDYASAGPVGAILGYWMSRRWYRQRTEEAAPVPPAPGAPKPPEVLEPDILPPDAGGPSSGA